MWELEKSELDAGRETALIFEEATQPIKQKFKKTNSNYCIAVSAQHTQRSNKSKLSDVL